MECRASRLRRETQTGKGLPRTKFRESGETSAWNRFAAHAPGGSGGYLARFQTVKVRASPGTDSNRAGRAPPGAETHTVSTSPSNL